MSGNSGKGKAQRAKRAKASRVTASHHAPRASKRAFQTLAVNIPGMVYRVHLREKNRMEFFNEMVEQMTGYRVADLLEGEVCSIDLLIVPEDRFRVLEIVRDSVKENKFFEVEYRLSHKNGSTRTFLERGRPIYGHDDQPQFIDGVIMDITERKRAEEATKESEKKAWEQAARLQATLDAAPVIIWTAHDRDCRVISGNRAARELSQVDETVNMSKTGPEPERLAHYRILKDGRELAPEEMPIQIVAKSGKELRKFSLSFVLANGTCSSSARSRSPFTPWPCSTRSWRSMRALRVCRCSSASLRSSRSAPASGRPYSWSTSCAAAVRSSKPRTWRY